MKRRTGFVLPTILIFLDIFALLSLFGLAQLKEKMHIITQQHKHMTEVAQLNSILYRIVDDESQFCRIETAKNLAVQPLSWWQLNGCRIVHGNLAGYYILRHLNMDACATGKNDGDMIADYYQYTVYLMTDNDSFSRLLIQTTYAKPVPRNAICRGKPHVISFGRQTWFELA